MKTLSFLKTYWRPLFTIGLCVGLAAWHSLAHPTGGTIQDIYRLILLVFATILGLQFAEAVESSVRHQKQMGDLRALLAKFPDIKARLVHLRTMTEFRDLFGGLSGSFISFNPHIYAPRCRELDEAEIVRVSLERYRDSGFKMTWYLCCVQDDYGKANFVELICRMVRIARSESAVVSKVQIRVLGDKNFQQEPSFHLQTKDTPEERCVVELRVRNLMLPEAETPMFYVVTTSSDVCGMSRRYFDQHWGRKEARSIDLDTLIKLIPPGTDDGKTRAAVYAYMQWPAPTPPQ